MQLLVKIAEKGNRGAGRRMGGVSGIQEAN